MNRIKDLRQMADMKQTDLAKRLNVRQNTISNWETGRSEPDNASLFKMSTLFDVSVDYLLGNVAAITDDACSIPVLGTVPAGIPLEAVEDIIDWEDIPKSMCSGGRSYFGLRVYGDSMYPDFLDGDVVIVRKQPECECGDICVVYVNGYDATLKQVKRGDDGSLTIIPRNPQYPPRTFTASEVKDIPVTIAGVVVELRRKIEK